MKPIDVVPGRFSSLLNSLMRSGNVLAPMPRSRPILSPADHCGKGTASLFRHRKHPGLNRFDGFIRRMNLPGTSSLFTYGLSLLPSLRRERNHASPCRRDLPPRLNRFDGFIRRMNLPGTSSLFTYGLSLLASLRRERTHASPFRRDLPPRLNRFGAFIRRMNLPGTTSLSPSGFFGFGSLRRWCTHASPFRRDLPPRLNRFDGFIRRMNLPGTSSLFMYGLSLLASLRRERTHASPCRRDLPPRLNRFDAFIRRMNLPGTSSLSPAGFFELFPFRWGRWALPLLMTLAIAMAPAWGQTADPSPSDPPEAQWIVSEIGVADGLSQSGVLATVQDRFGFLWFGSQNGLNRYDGYAFRVFGKQDPEVPADIHLSGNVMQALMIDRDDRLWIGTRDGGISIWDGTTNDVAFRLEPGAPDTPSFEAIGDFWQAPDGTVWVATLGAGLLSLDAALQVNGPIWPGAPNEATAAANHVHCLMGGADGTLWLGTEQGLFRYDSTQPNATPEAVPLSDDPEAVLQVADGVIGPDGALWLATIGQGLFRYDPGQGTIRHWRHDPSDETGLAGNRLWCLGFTRSGQLLIGTMNQGLQILDPSSERFYRLQESRQPAVLKTRDRIWSLYEDAAGIIWIGTAGKGLLKAVPNRTPFRHVARMAGAAEKDDLVVTSVLADSDHRFWVGTWGQGLLQFDLETERLTTAFAAGDRAEATPQLITHLYRDTEGILWLGAWRQGLLRFDPQSGDIQSFKWPADPGERPAYSIVRIIPEGSRLWLATYGSGLVAFDRDSAEFTRFRADPDNPEALNHDMLMTLLLDDRRRLWVGTVGGGLNRLDAERAAFRHWTPDPASESPVPGRRITVLAADAAGGLWVGTDGDGLYRYHEAQDRFERWSRHRGLSSDTINGILFDREGALWIGTNRGITRLHPETDESRIYGPSQGLQYEYVAGAFDAGDQGLMMFGGAKGFDYFDPSWLEPNRYEPPVVLTDFRIFNRRVSLESDLHRTEHLTLRHDQNYFSFEFAALEFSFPDQNGYAYKMEGFDRDWIDSGSRRFAGYTNLDGGDYRFRVRATNSDGQWSAHEAQIAITVVPPFWKRTGFIVGCFVLTLLSTGGLIYLWSLRKVRMWETRAEREATMNRGQSEARENERLRIARDLHDGPIQDLHAIQLRLSLTPSGVHRETDTYLRRVIQQLRWLCGELRPPAITQFGLSVAIRSHVEALKQKHPKQAIQLRLMNDGQSLGQETRLALFRICQEALNNAIQHAACETVHVLFEWDSERLRLEVRDDGVGFQQRDYYEWSQSGHYGLMGIAERARAIGGELEIQSTPGSGTRVSVAIAQSDNREAIA
ncbi:HATPase-c domain-containing protein [Sulfidibacter corallicola]|uniref:Histidine kinase/HSP90-like ATPase domain-containing protein n=1 Tax=Sulfidibacter corallicola TaxID=2818388 RepID=A0A8A4TIT4_SULCO|nr:sensor histidine kinase [Sulfidibacter corallicola]QTD48708.1 hypothetical protein J3U87_24265 [Sulfidibacter corallicola]